jgi:hypothetical protein
MQVANAHSESRPSKTFWVEWLCVAIVGAFGFLFSTSFTILNPRNTTWLRWGDSAQHYLGWEFFRRSELLQFPIGNNPSFGQGFSSTIFFSDSIPLLAIPLKYLLRPISGDFQYFGIWIMACFLLQAIFSFKIISRFVNYPFLRILIICFFCITPAFIFRFSIDGFGHFALGSHFLILWAIDTYLKSQNERKHWFWVLVCACFIQPYMFLIILPIFLASEMRAIFSSDSKSEQVITSLVHFVKIGVGISVLLFVFGGLSIGGLEGDRLTTFRATLTSLIDASPTFSTSWSSLLRDIPAEGGTNEGFAFLGLGVLIVLLLVFLRKIVDLSFFIPGVLVPLFIAAVVSFVISHSPQIGRGSHDLFKIPTGQYVYSAWSIARSAGRFIWVPMYLTMIWTFVMVVKFFHRQLIRLSFFLVVILVLQIFDGREAFSESRERFVHSEILHSDQTIWNKLASGKKHLIVIPSLNNDPEWVDLAFLANRHNMTTNAASIDRINKSKLSQFDAKLQIDLENFRFKTDTLYVITDYPPNPFRNNLIKYFDSPRLPFQIYVLNDLLVISAKS